MKQRELNRRPCTYVVATDIDDLIREEKGRLLREGMAILGQRAMVQQLAVHREDTRKTDTGRGTDFVFISSYRTYKGANEGPVSTKKQLQLWSNSRSKRTRENREREREIKSATKLESKKAERLV